MFFTSSTNPSPITRIAFSALVLGLAFGCSGSDDPSARPKPKVPVVTVTQRDVPIETELVGQTIGSLDIAVRARVDGTLEGLHFEEGRPVEKDQLLYTIDSRPFEQKVVEAESKLAEAKTQAAKAQADLKRIKPLAAISAVSKRELDAAIAQDGAAKASVQAAEAAVEFAKIELSYTQIKAPVHGLIGITKAKVGDYVGKEPNPVVLNTISQIDPIHVRVTISEREYLQLARKFLENNSTVENAHPKNREMQAPLTLILADGYKHPQIGHIHAVNNQIDPTTGTLTIEASFPNPQKIVRPGQYARISTVSDVEKNALLIPQRSVQELQGTYQVFLVTPQNIVELRQVTPGAKIESMWVIDQGLKPGEKVVVEGLQQIKEGMLVEPVSPQAMGVSIPGQQKGTDSQTGTNNK